MPEEQTVAQIITLESLLAPPAPPTASVPAGCNSSGCGSSQAPSGVAALDASVVLAAVATSGGGRINEHFGHAREFQIYEVSSAGIRFVEHRRVEQYCQGGWGEDATLDGMLAMLAGVACVLVAKVGECPRQSLRSAGIEASQDYAYEWIESGIAAWYAARHRLPTQLTA